LSRALHIWRACCISPLFFLATSDAADYHVGPGQALSAIADVPWATLAPGDRVFIHWRASPYKEKWVINRRGTASDWIVIAGVPGPQGQLPVIDGRDAVTPTNLSYWNEQRGLIKIGGSSNPPDDLPAYIRIENLELRSAHANYAFTDDSGNIVTYADNAAAIYVEKAEHLVVRNCVIHDSGNGIFTGSFSGQSRNHVFEGNHIFGNGNIGSLFEHNSYTEAIGTVYQWNRFGPLRAGALGNNLKDRSAGLVVRYNWIEDGNRQLDLVDGPSAVSSAPEYDTTFVYGNVLIESDGEGNSQIAHYGGDSGVTSRYRKGTLYFFHNTVVSTRVGNTTLLRLSTNDESSDVRNNVLYVSDSGNRLAMLDSAGALTLRNNWTKPGWRGSHSGLSGTIDDDGSGVTSASPDFQNEAARNYRPTGTPLAGAAALPASGTAAHPVDRQYLEHTTTIPRTNALDIGAFEWCIDECAALFADRFEIDP
jgi:hypothetical protein